jgi:hypothetical protein
MFRRPIATLHNQTRRSHKVLGQANKAAAAPERTYSLELCGLALSICKLAAVALNFGRHTDKLAASLGKMVPVRNWELNFCPCGRNSMKTKPVREKYADNIVFLDEFVFFTLTGACSRSSPHIARW